jgi:ATP-binding cassette, subfamily B, bacterial
MNFPLFKQLDSMDCGTFCLRKVAIFYGKTYSLQSLRSREFITKSGVSMLGISDAAESIGFRTHGYPLTLEQLYFLVEYEIRKQRRLLARSREQSVEGKVKD